MKTLESAILHEARRVVGKQKLRLKDIMEWSTSEEKVKSGLRPGEALYHLPGNSVWIAVGLEVSK